MRSKATTIATNILIDAFRAGVFEHSKWYAWKQDLAAYPNFESAVSLLEKHAAELGIVVPAFRNHPWKYLLDGCPLMASLIERESAVNGHATSSPAGPAMLTPAQQADKLGLPMVLTGSAKRNKLTQRVRKHALKVGYRDSCVRGCVGASSSTLSAHAQKASLR
jgi:hypothetical protein